MAPISLPLEDIRDLAEDLLREATLASVGMQYARQDSRGKVQVPAGTPEHIRGVEKYLRQLVNLAS